MPRTDPVTAATLQEERPAEGTDRPGTPRPQRTRRPRRGRSAPLVHLAPALLAIGLTTVYPLLSALVTSLQEWRLNETRAPGGFVGLENYRKALGDEQLWNSLTVTLQFTVVSVVAAVGLGLAIALLLNHASRLSRFTQAALILPFAVAPALKGYSWRFMLNPDTGVYDRMLDTLFPFAQDIDWLGSPVGAMAVLLMTEVWGWAPLIALMFLGGLAAIPNEVREAARIDGAGIWQEFTRITFPLLRPLILIVVFLKAIWAVKIFDQVVTTTGGGPGRSTETLNFYAYQQGFTFLDIGYASAVSWILVLVLGVGAAAYLVAMNRQEGAAP